MLFNHEHKETADYLMREIDIEFFYSTELSNAKLDRHGWNYAQPCCFNENDKHNSLHINLKTGAFECKACGIEGKNIIEFAIAKYKIQMAEVLAGLELKYDYC